MASVPGLLRDVLDELAEKDLKRLKAHLRDQRLLPAGKLEGADVDDLVDLLVQELPDWQASRRVQAILRDMRKKQLAVRLTLKPSKGNLKRPRDIDPRDNTTQIKRRNSCVRQRLCGALKKKFCRIHNQTVYNLQDIYTELYVVEGRSGWVNNTHEVMHIESSPHGVEEQSINLANIFQKRSNGSQPVSKVLTLGIAGVGKTIAVQKFVMDWVEGATNQDIDLVFVLLFRELNLRKGCSCSLLDLLLLYHPGINGLGNTPEFKKGKILFILDGLDESNLQLDLERCDLCQPTTKSSVDKVISSLLHGILMPSALIWVTTRPAAANLIRHFHLDTEVRGFNNPQKDEYFRKVIGDRARAEEIIVHVKSKRSLHIMCHIPVFCSITATVLSQMLDCSSNRERLPQTLTEMYAYYVAFQIKQIGVKYMRSEEKLSQEAKHGLLVKLGKLAFSHLAEGKLIFYEQDLRACNIDVTKASLHSGLCTQIFDIDNYCTDENIYSFVHLSVQEFLAALYVLHMYTTTRENPLVGNCLWKKIMWKLWNSPFHLHKVAVDKALQSQTGHLDLFLRFLLGLVPVVERRGVLSQTLPKLSNGELCNSQTCDYIKRRIREELSPDRTINLFHCLSELGDDSLVEEINRFGSSGEEGKNLTLTQCSALAYLLLMSAEHLEEFDLRRYLRSADGLYRMLPVVKVSRRVWLNQCQLSKASCHRMASVLRGTPSHLRELDMTDNDLRDEGVQLLCVGLRHTQCKLEILRLSGCLITEKGCSFLASALKSNPSFLKELDLSYNHPGDSGVRELTDRQDDGGCKLEIFNYFHGGEIRMKPGLTKYMVKLSLDSSTAHRQLRVSDGKESVAWMAEDQPYPEHADRFQTLHQVLCGQALSGERFYWEVECTGEVYVGVTYKHSDGDNSYSSTVIGHNAVSWSLDCSKGGEYVARHAGKAKPIPYRHGPGAQRIGTYLDCHAGSLSFYAVQSDWQTHLYTFNGNSFTEPLYPAFWLHWDASVHLCARA